MRHSNNRRTMIAASVAWAIAAPVLAMGERDVSDTPQSISNCIVGGCSGELCTDAANGDMMTNCDYRAEYACYKGAECTHQSDKKCGWTQTDKLRACLSSPSKTQMEHQ